LLDARSLPPGQYLFGVRPEAALRSYAELAVDLDALIRRIELPRHHGAPSSPA
jgi:hypothetical protein